MNFDIEFERNHLFSSGAANHKLFFFLGLKRLLKISYNVHLLSKICKEYSWNSSV